jgi:predicted deacylase
MFLTRSFRLASAAVLPAVLFAGSIVAQEPRTGAEVANFERHTSHAELMDFLYEVQSRTDRMRIRPIAVTNEGREMPLVMLGAPPTATPATAFFSGKPLIFITGNVHGGERAGREGTLQLIRELVLGSQRELLDRVNVLIVPTLNPDGAERRTRTNTLGYDMNRDFIVAETPEITAVVEDVLTEWWPDVYVDVHNGGAYPYNLTYQATLHPSADQALVAFARGPLFEAVKTHLAAQNMTLYWYSGPRRDEETGQWSWYTTPPWARKQHTYGGLQNIITMLYEIPGRWTLAEQAANAREGLIGLIRYMADNAATVRSTVVEARRRTLHSPAAEVVVDVEESAYPNPEQFFVMQDSQPALVTGMNRTLFVSTRARPRPQAYAFGGNLHAIAKLLRRHAIEVERLGSNATVQAERFRLDSIAWESAPYQNHLNATPAVTAVPASVELPAGTYIVRMNQNAARLVSELFEPDTDDSLVVWNFLDHALPAPDALQRRTEPYFLPFYRVMQTAGLRTTIIP